MDYRAFRPQAVAVATVVTLCSCAWWQSQTPAPESASGPAAQASTSTTASAEGGAAPVRPSVQSTAPAAATPAPAPVASAAPAPVEQAMQDEDTGGPTDPLSAYPDDTNRPVRFHDAVARAAKELFKQARPSIGTEPRLLVIDPLVDGATGQQTASTVEMGKILADLVKQQYPTLTPAPLTRTALADKPVLFIGTLTAFNTNRSRTKPADAFRVWLTLIDLRTGTIVGKSIEKATAETVDAVPLGYYRDSPTWSRDKIVAAYINSCTFKTKIGDPADPAYLAHLPAAAAINEAMQAFTADQYEEANRLYREAQGLSDEDDLRVLNGIYLTSWKLGRQDEARAAFDRIVVAGLHAQHLPLKFLFVPAKSELVHVGDLSSQYTMWLREVAMEASQNQACLRVVGHTSKTGSVAMNDSLSYARADSIRAQLSTDTPVLQGRLTAQGRGSRENLIGLGTDDVRDALDRRVEFVVTNCAAS